MPYEAKVKDNVIPKTVRFSGDFEFVRYEWRPLPDEKLELAQNNPYLELRPTDKLPEPVIEEEPERPKVWLEGGVVTETLEKDNLTEIKGVGKATAVILAGLGYTSFEKLSNEDVAELQGILSKQGFPTNKLDAADVIKQAKELKG